MTLLEDKHNKEEHILTRKHCCNLLHKFEFDFVLDPPLDKP